ncbi:arenicin-2-like [Ptychodera flava]|uniref:arenicin-2-like n=1 Tax=Ptychodera flava TaxID=63121 RepID=UPI00396A5A10
MKDFVVVFCLLVVTGCIGQTLAKPYAFKLVVERNGEKKEELVIVDEEKNVEIFREYGSDTKVVVDFDTGLEAFVHEERNACYIRPFDSNKYMTPKELKRKLRLQAGKEIKQQSEDIEYYTVAGGPIKNSMIVGETIGQECEGKAIYWLKCGQPNDAGASAKPWSPCRVVCFYYDCTALCD